VEIKTTNHVLGRPTYSRQRT